MFRPEKPGFSCVKCSRSAFYFVPIIGWWNKARLEARRSVEFTERLVANLRRLILQSANECYDTAVKLLKKTPLIQDSIRNAKAMVEVWHDAKAPLEAERLQRLRGLSELDGAQQFARLLQIRSPYPLRPSSGLVEQQRILARLRTQK